MPLNIANRDLRVFQGQHDIFLFVTAALYITLYRVSDFHQQRHCLPQDRAGFLKVVAQR